MYNIEYTPLVWGDEKLNIPAENVIKEGRADPDWRVIESVIVTEAVPQEGVTTNGLIVIEERSVYNLV